LTQIATLTAGAITLMWIGELITERGIGNGISFIIFAGIVSRAPSALGAFIANPNITLAIAFGIVAIAAVAVIIYIQEGQRRIPIQYASRVRGRRMYSGGQTFLPLRVNQAGVIPIIFAVSILLFPHQLATYFSTSDIPIVKGIANFIVTIFSTSSPFYIVTYFLLTMGFTYFYTAFTFKPDETAEQLRKNGGFIPGIRPGRPTEDYLRRVVTRITFAGALFLAIVAVSPSIVALAVPDLAALGLGGTSLLIVVSVVVETMKQIEAQLMMRNYEGFIR
jgi:preprotein translocase subunit SecY